MANDNTRDLDALVENLAKRGVALPKNDARKRLDALSMHRMGVTGIPGMQKDFLTGTGAVDDIAQLDRQNSLIRKMGENRRLRKQSTTTGGDTYSAIPRFYDPIEYWDLSGLPWNMADEGHRHKLHKWLRLYYSTHYLVPILIDIFTRFPLVGMELKCKDHKVQEFYEDLFIGELDYPEFLVQLGREYWTVGEAFPLGSFDEDLGVWEREELLNPEDIVIENFPLLGSKQLKIVPPEYLKKLAQTKMPAKEWKQLEINFPELIPYLRKNEHIPISPVLLKQVSNTITSWDDHGTPILLRGLRTLLHEEKLLASQDAIAERLYSPLILAKLGAMDLGDGQGPWIPSPDELDAFRDDMDYALSSDFRLLVHHFGLEVENVFGREQMPRLGDDFDRVERRIMQIFGVNPSLLSAGANSQPYASSALQAEFLNQILRTFQGYLRKHYEARAKVVAEAQEHYEYEVKGGKRIPIMEEVVVYDQEGNKSIETRHKLLIPDLEFATLDLRDEATERQYMQTMRMMGVPIPDSKLMVGVDIDIEEMTDAYNDELVSKTVKQQEAKMKAYKALDARNLPIPPDLRAEVESVMQQGAPPAGGGAGAMGGPAPGGGAAMGNMPPGGAPMPPGGGMGMIMPPMPPGLGPGGFGNPMGAPPAGATPQGGAPGGTNAPAVSMERRPGMPQPPPRGASAKNSAVDNGDSPVHTDSEEEKTELHPTEETPDEIIERLPKAKKVKSYTIIDPDVEPIDESANESSGQVSGDD